jgi:hypothetical protein
LRPSRHRIGHEREHVMDQDLRMQHKYIKYKTIVRLSSVLDPHRSSVVCCVLCVLYVVCVM